MRRGRGSPVLLGVALVVAGVFAAGDARGLGGDTQAPAARTNAVRSVSVEASKTERAASARRLLTSEKKVGKPAKAAKKQLSGAELYALHCNRCHPERYAPERTEVQWETILMHMRVRANLPTKEAKAILKYLQEDSGK